jgi:hypothetical protein
MNGVIGSLIDSVSSVNNVQLERVVLALFSWLKVNGDMLPAALIRLLMVWCQTHVGMGKCPRLPLHDLALHCWYLGEMTIIYSEFQHVQTRSQCVQM